MADEPKDAVDRLQARADYCALPAGQRSVSALFTLYIENNRAGEAVPTTHRNTLFRWSNEDDWRGYLLRLEVERLEAEKVDLTRFRKRALHRLSVVFDEAVEMWHQLITDPEVDNATRAKLIVELADRVGFPKESRIASQRRGDDTPTPPTAAPGPEASETELATYYARTGGQG